MSLELSVFVLRALLPQRIAIAISQPKKRSRRRNACKGQSWGLGRGWAWTHVGLTCELSPSAQVTLCHLNEIREPQLLLF